LLFVRKFLFSPRSSSSSSLKNDKLDHSFSLISLLSSLHIVVCIFEIFGFSSGDEHLLGLVKKRKNERKINDHFTVYHFINSIYNFYQ